MKLLKSDQSTIIGNNEIDYFEDPSALILSIAQDFNVIQKIASGLKMSELLDRGEISKHGISDRDAVLKLVDILQADSMPPGRLTAVAAKKKDIPHVLLIPLGVYLLN